MIERSFVLAQANQLHYVVTRILIIANLTSNRVVVLNRWCKYILTLLIRVLRKLKIKVMNHKKKYLCICIMHVFCNGCAFVVKCNSDYSYTCSLMHRLNEIAFLISIECQTLFCADIIIEFVFIHRCNDKRQL